MGDSAKVERNISGQQFKPGDYDYKVHQYENDQGVPTEVSVGIFAPDSPEGIGHISASRSADKYKVGLVYVRPDYRGKGLASTALNVLNHHIGPGMQVSHSEALSPEGYKFATSTPGKVPVDHPTMRSWDSTLAFDPDDMDRSVAGEYDREGDYVYGARSMQMAADWGTKSEVARFLGTAPPAGPSEETYKQGQMFRHIGGKGGSEVVRKRFY